MLKHGTECSGTRAFSLKNDVVFAGLFRICYMIIAAFFILNFFLPFLSFSSTIFGRNFHIVPSCRLPQLTAAIELVSEISRQLNERKSEAVAEITSTFEELERALHQRKTALITDLENICSTKQKASSVSHVHIPSTCTHAGALASLRAHWQMRKCTQAFYKQAVEHDLPHVSHSCKHTSACWLNDFDFSTPLSSSSCSFFAPFFPYLHLTWAQVLQAQLSSLLQGKEHIQSSCSFTEQALSHGSATEVGWQIVICTSKLTNRLQGIWESAIKCVTVV